MIFKPDRERMWDRPEANIIKREFANIWLPSLDNHAKTT
jgi:hypothetical protein